MALTLFFHPLASFCHKVLIALYENETSFEGHIVDLMDKGASSEFLGMWPVGKIPLLRDEDRNLTIPETTIIIEYLDWHYPGKHALLPKDAGKRLDARLWDRFFDLYVHVPMQKVVTDRLRSEGEHDLRGAADAKTTLRKLRTAYDMIERRMADKIWAIGERFSIADCAAAPALFYAGIVIPFHASHPNIAAYFERLLERPSFGRVVAEARPYFNLFPLKDEIPARLLTGQPS
jgi:glutathione S-transferase